MSIAGAVNRLSFIPSKVKPPSEETKDVGYQLPGSKSSMENMSELLMSEGKKTKAEGKVASSGMASMNATATSESKIAKFIRKLTSCGGGSGNKKTRPGTVAPIDSILAPLNTTKNPNAAKPDAPFKKYGDLRRSSKLFLTPNFALDGNRGVSAATDAENLVTNPVEYAEALISNIPKLHWEDDVNDSLLSLCIDIDCTFFFTTLSQCEDFFPLLIHLLILVSCRLN